MLNTYLVAKALGEKHYQGKPCVKGHNVIGKRYVISGNCVECNKYKRTGKPRNFVRPERAEAIKNNQKYYFTGKPCKAGHLSKRLTSSSRCEACHEIYMKTKRREHERKYSITKYGITLDQYNEMLQAQNEVCKICKEPEKSLNGKGTKLKPLAIDHCHKTGKIRGLLCSRCNIGIGSLMHNSTLLRKAALYCEEL